MTVVELEDFLKDVPGDAVIAVQTGCEGVMATASVSHLMLHTANGKYFSSGPQKGSQKKVDVLVFS
jgi:hypothetical protein